MFSVKLYKIFDKVKHSLGDKHASFCAVDNTGEFSQQSTFQEVFLFEILKLLDKVIKVYVSVNLS